MDIKADKLATALKLISRNAMSPGIVHATLIGFACIGAALIAEFWLALWLMVIFSILTVGIFGIFAFHSFTKPENLRTEDYLLKRDAITIYGSSSYDGEQIVDLIAQRVSEDQLKLEDKQDG